MSAAFEVVRTFKVHNTEEAVLDKWLTEHKGKCKYWGDTMANPGNMRYFTPSSPLLYQFKTTGIGDCVFVKCLCGEEIDITDYDSF